MSNDIIGMESLVKEMKEEAQEEIEAQAEETTEEEQEEAETEIAAETQDEKAKEAATKEEDPEEEPTDRKPKTPEDFKKLRLALKEKTKKEQELNKELEKERLEKAKLEGYKEGSTKQQPAVEVKKEDEDPEPDQEYDALNWLKWNARQQNKKIDANTKQAEKVSAVTQAQLEQNAIIKLDNEFKATQPDYEDAVNYVLGVEKKALKARSPNMTDAQIDQYLISEKVRLYKEVYNAGGVPGKVVMEMATAYGYQPKKKAPNNPDGKNQFRKPNIDVINKNMKKSAPMSGSAAGKGGDIDPESIFDMSIAKLATMPKSKWDKAEREAREIDSDDF